MTTEHQVTVQRQDLEKMQDVLVYVQRRLKRADEANAALHMTPVRYSPLTASVETVVERLKSLIEGVREDDNGDGNGEEPEAD